MTDLDHDDPDGLLAQAILEAEDNGGAPPLESELVRQLEAVQAIATAFDSLDVSSPATLPPPFPTWGSFVLKEEVGRGRFGIVCRAFDPAVEREIAVKLYMSGELPPEPRLMARVRHPNAVTVFGAAIHDGHSGIWMEYLRGRTLAERVQADGPLSPLEAARIGTDLCSALSAVHDAGLLHQDVKPRNVMEQEDGRIVLMDFGAGLLAPSPGRESRDRYVGTPLYMAPEILLGGTPSASSDIYSLGVLLYYLMTGTYPVYAPDVSELRRLHERQHRLGTRRAVAALRELRPDVSPALAEAVARALAPVGRRYPTAQSFRDALDAVEHSGHRSSRRISIAVAVAAIAAAFAAGIAVDRWRASPRPVPFPVLRRLTFDPGLATDPAISSDGSLLVYSSSQAGQGLNLWVKRTSGGPAVPLTKGDADDVQASFSPDGTRIAFRSERDGGIYVIPTLGGDATLLSHGYWPRFSPDGSRIAFVGNGGGHGAPVFVVHTNGTEQQQLPVVAVTVAPPVWSPDGRRLMVFSVGTNEDWTVVPTDGSGPKVPTGAVAALFPAFGRSSDIFASARDAGIPDPFQWRPGKILFAARTGDTTNIWEADIDDRTFRVSAAPRRLTMGMDIETQPMAAGERIVFSAHRLNVHLWSLPLDAERSAALAELRPLTHDPGAEQLPSLSADGRTLVFLSARNGGPPDIWAKNAGGPEKGLTAAMNEQQERYLPIVARDGTRVIYQQLEGTSTAIYAVPVEGGLPQKICTECGGPSDLSQDGRTALTVMPGARTHERAEVGVVDTAAGMKATILKHADYNLYRAHFSPDERWIVFHGDRSGTSQVAATRIFVAPFRGAQAVPENEWIAITDGRSFDDAPRWSPDGRWIYYVSDRDGSRCIWAQPLDPKTRKPEGDPVPVQHFHNRPRGLKDVPLSALDLAVGADRLIFTLAERSGDIWAVAPFR